jgi:hypothetical protein
VRLLCWQFQLTLKTEVKASKLLLDQAIWVSTTEQVQDAQQPNITHSSITSILEVHSIEATILSFCIMLLMSSLKIMEIQIQNSARFYNRLTLIILGIFTLHIRNMPQQDQNLTETSPQVVTCSLELRTTTMITFQHICQLSPQELELTRPSKL